MSVSHFPFEASRKRLKTFGGSQMPIDNSIVVYDETTDRYNSSSVTVDDLLASGSGEAGGPQVFAGAWASGTQYLVGQFVTHDGLLWRTTTTLNSTTPGADASWVNVLEYTSLESLDPTIRDVILGVGDYDLANAALIQLIIENSSTLFRGAYSALEILTTYNFAGGALPSTMTHFLPAYGGDNFSINDGNDDPTEPAGKVIYFTGIAGGQNAGVDLTVPAGITAIRWKWQLGGGSAYWRALKNGAEIATRTTFSNAYTEVSAAVAPGDVIRFAAMDSGNNGGVWRLGLVELGIVADPYMLGQVVAHLGKLWRSNVDNNASVPGADGNWTSLLDGYLPSTTDIKNIVRITQAAYDALVTKVSTTLYLIAD